MADAPRRNPYRETASKLAGDDDKVDRGPDTRTPHEKMRSFQREVDYHKMMDERDPATNIKHRRDGSVDLGSTLDAINERLDEKARERRTGRVDLAYPTTNPAH